MAGAGSSGSLVAALACVFLALSAAIVFKGWPGGPGERLDTQVIGGSAPVAAGGVASGAAARARAGAGGAVPGAQGVLGVRAESPDAPPASASPAGAPVAGAAPTPARGRSQPGVTRNAGGGRSPAASGPSAVDTVTAITERASSDFGPIGADITDTVAGGGDGLVGGDPAVGEGVGDSAPPVGGGDVGDAIEEAGDRGGDAVDGVSDALGGRDRDRGAGKD